ncbi:MAG: OsmC family protein [Candidatus Kaelpia aquatica]|nr:OsmC family protein [Candidatus Kaelpia aquatica]
MQLDLDLELKGEEFDVRSKSSGVNFKIGFTEESQSEPNPLEVFLSSVASCVGVFAVKYLKGAKIDFNKLNINVKSSLIQQGSMKLDNIVLSLDTDAELAGRREAFLRFIRKCPIHNTILDTDRVEFVLKEQ